jgi:hypothetical protein
MYVGISLLNRTAPDVVTEILDPGQTETEIPQGYVDQSGLIQALPPDLPNDAFRAYGDEDAARAALKSGEISAYYLIPEDYLESGQISYVKDEFNPLNAFSQGSLINRVLQLNMLGGDTHLANVLANPFALQVMILNPSNGLSDDNPLAFFLPYGVMFLYYMLILMSAGFLVSSLNKGKGEQRIGDHAGDGYSQAVISGKIPWAGADGLAGQFPLGRHRVWFDATKRQQLPAASRIPNSTSHTGLGSRIFLIRLCGLCQPVRSGWGTAAEFTRDLPGNDGCDPSDDPAADVYYPDD